MRAYGIHSLADDRWHRLEEDRGGPRAGTSTHTRESRARRRAERQRARLEIRAGDLELMEG